MPFAVGVVRANHTNWQSAVTVSKHQKGFNLGSGLLCPFKEDPFACLSATLLAREAKSHTFWPLRLQPDWLAVSESLLALFVKQNTESKQRPARVTCLPQTCHTPHTSSNSRWIQTTFQATTTKCKAICLLEIPTRKE